MYQMTDTEYKFAELIWEEAPFVEKAYGGSLPKMIAAFIQSKKLSPAQITEIEAMIEDYKG